MSFVCMTLCVAVPCNVYKPNNSLVQSPLVIVYLVIVEFPIIVDRLCRPIVYFSMHFSRNSGITRYSGQILADGRVHYYERRLYQPTFFWWKWQSICVIFLNPTDHCECNTESIAIKLSWLETITGKPRDFCLPT